MATALPTPSGTLDFGRAFTVVTEDPEWVKKVLIGGGFALLSSVIVGAPFVFGYLGRMVRNVAAGVARPLPEWDDLGGIFGEGLRLLGAYLVHLLGVLAVVAALGCLAWLPIMALGGLGADVADAVGAVAGLGMVAAYGLFMLLSLLLAVYVPSVLVRVAITGELRAGLDWRRNVAFIRANLANYALSLVVGIVGTFVAQFGIVLCCVGIFPAAFWAYLAIAAALGETVRLNPASL